MKDENFKIIEANTTEEMLKDAERLAKRLKLGIRKANEVSNVFQTVAMETDARMAQVIAAYLKTDDPTIAIQICRIPNTSLTEDKVNVTLKCAMFAIIEDASTTTVTISV